MKTFKQDKSSKRANTKLGKFNKINLVLHEIRTALQQISSTETVETVCNIYF